MTHLETLVRLTNRQVRECRAQRRDSFVMAFIFLALAILRILVIDGTYGQEDVFGLALVALVVLLWLNRAHNADLLLALARARQNELVNIRVDAIEEGEHAIYGASLSSEMVADEILHALRRTATRPHDRYSLRKDETHD
jgi:hypothetical protein